MFSEDLYKPINYNKNVRCCENNQLLQELATSGE